VVENTLTPVNANPPIWQAYMSKAGQPATTPSGAWRAGE
jgi:hypothetical protein